MQEKWDVVPPLFNVSEAFEFIGFLFVQFDFGGFLFVLFAVFHRFLEPLFQLNRDRLSFLDFIVRFFFVQEQGEEVPDVGKLDNKVPVFIDRGFPFDGVLHLDP